jgi:hypothetical protein
MNKNILFLFIAAFSAAPIHGYKNQFVLPCLSKKTPWAPQLSISDMIRIVIHQKIDSISWLKRIRIELESVQNRIQKYREESVNFINQALRCDKNTQKVEGNNVNDVDPMLLILNNSL